MYSPIFHSVPTDPCGRWRLIRALAGSVYGLQLPEPGRRPDEVDAIEARLGGRALPPSLVEWVAFWEDLRASSEVAAGDFWRYSLRLEDFAEAESIVVNRWYDCFQWCVAYGDLGQEDPPVSAYAFVQKQKGFVRRKSYGRAPLSWFALHSVLNYSPWFSGWTPYWTMGSDLQDPKAFIEELRSRPGAQVSPALGSLTFIEGSGWVAWIQDGYGIYGAEIGLWIRVAEEASFESIPKAIRTQVGMKRHPCREVTSPEGESDDGE